MQRLLADVMIPDGAHLREEDWTVFLLNQQQPRQSPLETPPVCQHPTLSMGAYSYRQSSKSWIPLSSDQNSHVLVSLQFSTLTISKNNGKSLTLQLRKASSIMFHRIASLCVCFNIDGNVFGF